MPCGVNGLNVESIVTQFSGAGIIMRGDCVWQWGTSYDRLPYTVRGDHTFCHRWSGGLNILPQTVGGKLKYDSSSEFLYVNGPRTEPI